MGGHEQLQVLPCPSCGKVGTLDLCTRMVAPPAGAWPHADGRLKVLARETPVLVCTDSDCQFTRVPTLDNAVPLERRSPFQR